MLTANAGGASRRRASRAFRMPRIYRGATKTVGGRRLPNRGRRGRRSRDWHDGMHVSNKTAYTRAATLVLLVAVMVVLFRPAVQSLFPLGNDLEPSGDDWWTYHRYAVSVLHDGLRMPAVQGAYTRPGGFGYVYFVAACYAIFGV